MRECRPHKTEIDDLILFEQQVNLVNGPVVLMQLLRDAIQCCSEIHHYFMFFGATVLRKVLHICPYSPLGVDIAHIHP